MHIFNLNKIPNLIITNTELLFRDTPTDESMNRHSLSEIEKVSLEHRYNAEKELFVWLKVQMKAVKTPHLIQLSSLDIALEEVLLTLDKELSEKVNLVLPKNSWLNEVRTHHKRKKQVITAIALLLISLFLFHKFYTPSLDSFAKEALNKKFKKNSSFCSAQAKVAYKTSKKDWITVKSYCGVFGIWQEMQSKEIQVKHLETEFSPMTVAEYTKIIKDAIRSKNYPVAKETVDKVLYLEPKNANAHLLLGVIDYEMGDKDPAFLSIKKALVLEPNSLSILNRATYYYMKDKQYKQAQVYAQRALKLSNTAKGLQNLANIEYQLGETNTAIGHFEKSLYEDSNNTMTYNRLGLLYWKTKAYEKAEKVFKKAYEIEPSEASNFLNYYEISLITHNSFSTKEIEKFEKYFAQDKPIQMTYQMLRIIKLSINEENIMPSLQRWDTNYSGTKLNWSFEEILSWVDTNEMSEDKKHTIKKTIGFFIAYQQIYNLDHQDQKVNN